MIRRWLALTAIFFGMAASTLSAEEQTTAAERTYRELRKSHDTKTQIMAERWYGLVRLQEWTAASGKFKTTAKYVEHDPDLAWVKLRVVEGSGTKRVVKDITIPTSKLNKECQSRVRQIGFLTEKVAAAAAAEKEKASSEKAGEGAAGEMSEGRMMSETGTMAEEPRGGRGGRDAGLAGMAAGQVVAEGERSQGPEHTETARSKTAPTATSNSPLPALLPPLPSDRAQLGHSLSSPSTPPAADAATAEPNYERPGSYQGESEAVPAESRER